MVGDSHEPEDGLPTNYVLHTSAEETPTLVSVDHDHALFPALHCSREKVARRRTWILETPAAASSQNYSLLSGHDA